jgi:hypothetical protein
MAEKNDTSDEKSKQNFTLPENDPSEGIFPKSISNMLVLEEDAIKNDPDANWETFDKSIKNWTSAITKAGAIVFGYVDGNGKFIKADSDEDAHKIFEETGDLFCLSYNPRPITVGVRVTGYDSKGHPSLELTGEPEMS